MNLSMGVLIVFCSMQTNTHVGNVGYKKTLLTRFRARVWCIDTVNRRVSICSNYLVHEGMVEMLNSWYLNWTPIPHGSLP